MASTPRLPPEEFSYIGRPAETFEGRWAAIEKALSAIFGGAAFTLVDVGSNHGYFSLRAALCFPSVEVVGVEGSVGIGNGAVGASTRSVAHIAATSAIRTHLDWIGKLGLSNCFVAPEVWDFDYVLNLCKAGFRADAMLELSVVHHIDGICGAGYSRAGLGQVEGSLALIAGILRLADVHVLELPDRPWLEHLHDRFGSPRGIINAAAALTGEEWDLEKLYSNEWLGTRELWLLRSRCPRRSAKTSFRSFFPLLLPCDDLEALADDGAIGEGADAGGDTPAVPGDAAFASQVLTGRWRNAYGSTIEVTGRTPRLQCLYAAVKDSNGSQTSGEMRVMVWNRGRWTLETPAGHFTLHAASKEQLSWRESQGWGTQWLRLQC